MPNSGYIYLTRNNLNYKYYVGSHNGKHNYYYGSGIALKKAIKKYGKDNFTKTIVLLSGNVREDEQEILELLDLANDSRSYNLKNESLGNSKGHVWKDRGSNDKYLKISEANKGKNVGPLSGMYNDTVFTFYNKSLRVTEKCTCWELRTKYGLDPSHVSKLIYYKIKTCKGWRLV